jgi:NAD(P)H-dependent nitrite reductase small subunit
MAYTDTQLKPEQLAVGTSVYLQLGETQVGLFHTPTGLFALNNICPHRGASLHEGMVADGFVTCPWHQWQFQLEDGRCRNIPNARVTTYPLDVRDGTIWINLEEGATP